LSNKCDARVIPQKMQGNPVIAPHEACKGIQFAATTGSTTRRTKSVTVAPRIKINRIGQ
jgi:hypothetical protein